MLSQTRVVGKCVRGAGAEEHAQHRPGAVAYTGSFSRGVREGVPVSEKACCIGAGQHSFPRDRTHEKYAVWYGGIPGDEGRGAPNNVEALIPLEEEIRASQESPVKEPSTGKHQCKGNKLSCQ